MNNPMSFTPADDEVAELIRNRRTIHDFTPEVPPEELILQAIELARWAPNHKLTQPWRFRMVGPETKAAIVDLNTGIVRDNKGDAAAEQKFAKWSSVPGWLVISSLKSEDPVRDIENYASVCCGIQNMSLFLWNCGVGTKWISGNATRHHDFFPIVNIDPKAENIVGILWYGYPASVPDVKRCEVKELIQTLP